MEESKQQESVPTEGQADGRPQRHPKYNKTSFRKGNKAARGGQGKRVRKSPLYRDYEYVWTHQEGPFRSDGQRQLKQYLDEDRKGFLAQYSRLEQLHMAKTEKVDGPLSAGGKDAPSFDEGTERCLELIERWLKDRQISSQSSPNLKIGDNC